MKRWRERDYDPQLDQTYEDPKKPLWVEPIATRTRRDRYGLPALIGLFVVAAIVVATISRFSVLFSGPIPTATPGVTPITWVDTTVSPTTPPAPTPSASHGPVVATATAVTPRSIQARITWIGGIWYQGQANHFTLELDNTTGAPLSMVPCPTYRLYLATTNPSNVPLRQLNCEAIGQSIPAGGHVSLDMVYVSAANDPLGGNQTIVWQWMTPDTIQAIVTFGTVYIAS